MIKSRRSSITSLVLASMAWLVVWVVTHGFFMSDQMQSLISTDPNTRAIVTTVYILGVLTISLLVFKKYRQQTLIRSKQLYLYIIPAILIAVLPLHYHLSLNILIFIPMILLSVAWQDYLTFGLFQSYVQTKTNALTSVIIVGGMFTLGHLIFFLDSLVSNAALSWLALLAVGLLFAWIKVKYKTIYIINVLHLTFLFLFV